MVAAASVTHSVTIQPAIHYGRRVAETCDIGPAPVFSSLLAWCVVLSTVAFGQAAQAQAVPNPPTIIGVSTATRGPSQDSACAKVDDFAQPSLERPWHLSRFNLSNSDIPTDSVYAVATDPRGTVWVGGFNTVARLASGRWETFSLPDTENDRRIVHVVFDHRNDVWFGGRGGIAHYDGKVWSYHSKRSGTLPGDMVIDMLADDDRLWVATTQGIVLREDGEWKTIGRPTSTNLSAIAPGPVPGSVFALTQPEQPSGRPVYLYRDGHWHGPVFNWKLAYDIAFSRKDQRLYVLDTTRVLVLQGECLVGSRVCQVPDASQLSAPESDSWFPGHANLTSRLTLAPNGDLWVASRGDLYKSTGGALTRVLGLEERVNVIAPPADGVIWLGTDRGVVRAAPGLMATVMLPTNGEWPRHASVMQRTRDGALWIGFNNGGLGTEVSRDPGGLVRLLDGTWTCFDKTNSKLPNDRVTDLFASPDGDLWVGTEKGLVQRSTTLERVWTTQAKVLPSDFVLEVSGDSRATWVATQKGLARFDHQSGVWSHSAALNARFSENGSRSRPDHVQVDAQGDLLVGNSWNVSRVHLNPAGEPSLSPIHDGSVQGITLGASGRAYVAFSDRVYVLDGGTVHAVDEELAIPFVDQRLMCEDQSGALWAVGTRDRSGESGLFHYAPNERTQYFSWESLGMRSATVRGILCEADSVLILQPDRLHRFFPPRTRPLLELTDVPATIRDATVRIGAVAFDPTFLTSREQFRYEWTLSRDPLVGRSELVSRVENRNDVASLTLPASGRYAVSVTARDRFGRVSEGKTRTFTYAQESLGRYVVSAVQWVGATGALYLLLLPPLIALAPRYSWARVGVASGAFSKFPVAHRVVLNSRWARFVLLQRYAKRLSLQLSVPDNYMEQVGAGVRVSADCPATLSPSDLGRESRGQLQRIALVGRSGTGKSVFMKKACAVALDDFVRRRSSNVPVFIDLPTHSAERDIESIICDLLEGGGAGLPRDVLQFMVKQGAFVLFLDSLNESRDDAKVIGHIHQFMHADHANRIVVASQTDMLARQDVNVYELLPPDADQVRKYLHNECGRDVWSELPPAARDLAATPQDTALIAATLKHSMAVPLHRGDLYRELVSRDTALAELSKTQPGGLSAIYAVSFRMIRTRQLIIDAEQLQHWLEQSAEPSKAAVMEAIQQSRVFTQRRAVNEIGVEAAYIGFSHELLAKYFAAEHIVVAIVAPRDESELHALCTDDRWRDSLVFAVDRLARTDHFEWYLAALIGSSRTGLQVAAYALQFHASRVPDTIRKLYSAAEISNSAHAALLA